MTLNRRLTYAISALALTYMVWTGEPVRAQVAGTKGLVGVTGAWASDDAQRPERFNYERAHAVWSLQGAVFVAPRFAVGAEWAHLGTIEAPGGSSRAQILELHREHALFGTVRARLGSRGRSAVDLVGGVGAAFQRREAMLVGTGTTTSNSSSPAFVVRIEPVISVSRVVAITPTAGLYSLRRADATSSLVNLSRTLPSTRGFAGVGLAVRW